MNGYDGMPHKIILSNCEGVQLNDLITCQCLSAQSIFYHSFVHFSYLISFIGVSCINWNSNYSDQLCDYLKEMWGFIRRYGEYKLNLDLINLNLIFFLSTDQDGQNC